MSVYTPINTSKAVNSNLELGDEITLLAGQINAANYKFLKLIFEFDKREAWAETGVRSCAHWLNWKCGIALGAAREKLRIARCLEGLPKINEAFSEGKLSFSKVRAMTRAATNENEDYLMMIAENGTASHMEKLVSKFQTVKRRQLSTEEKKDELSPEQKRSFYSFQDDEGMTVIHAKLPAEMGSLVVKAIEAIVKQEKDVSAETFSETSEPVTFAQQRADAFSIMAEHYIATTKNASGTKSLSGNQRCQIMLHVDIKTLQAHQETKESCCHLDNKLWISKETAKRLSCDASIMTILEDDNGNVLNIGRRSRTIPSAIQHALNLRDNTCRVPGCCNDRYLDAHHIKHWADGGETSLDNLVMLCRKHHRELHQEEFSIKIQNEIINFIDKQGMVMKQAYFPQFNIKPFNNDWPKVDLDSLRNQWHGEVMDYGMAVDGLMG